MEWSVIIPILSVAGLWLGFLEKRLSTMKETFETRLRERNQINEIVQGQLRNDIARLESKIDMLIRLQFKSPQQSNGQD